MNKYKYLRVTFFNKYKYLRVTFSNNAKFSVAEKNLRMKASRAFFSIKQGF